MSSFFRAFLFRVIQIVLLPISAVGMVLIIAKMLVVNRKAKTSSTVLASVTTRFTQHRLGTRIDEPCARLMRVLPNVSYAGFSLVLVPTLLAQAVTGYVPRLYRFPYPARRP
jgi:hypothetical protein